MARSLCSLVLVLWAASATLLQLQLRTASSAAVPNVLMLIVDDLRPELEPYGFNSISSPNIKDFAKTAAQFNSAYCQYSLCAPSRSSFLTGLRPQTTQVFDAHRYFRNTPGLNNTVTLPQFFKNQGYRVAGGGKIFHPGLASGGDNDGVSWTEPYYTAPGKHRFEAKTVSWQARSEAESDFPDYKVASNAIQQLQSLKNDKFFIAMGLHKPHLPFVFPQSYLDRYPLPVALADDTSPPTDLSNIAWSNYAELRGYQDIANLNLRRGQGNWMPDSKAAELRRAYWAATSFVDDQIGRVLTELRTLGLDQNTTVVLLSDHGWHLGDMAEWGKGTTFEPANRVVLMIRDPSRSTTAGARISTNVELLDVYPTLVDIANYEIPATLQGKSLTPLLSGEEAPSTWKDASFSQILRASNAFASSPLMGYTVRTESWRYTEWVSYDTATGLTDWDDVQSVELFDHRDDPRTIFGYSERVNLAADTNYHTVREELSALLRTQTSVNTDMPIHELTDAPTSEESTSNPPPTPSESVTSSPVESPSQPSTTASSVTTPCANCGGRQRRPGRRRGKNGGRS
eukprot:scpid73095/ scgid33274/ Iduronate 2-sulfatase; Alpha-L-iduronate sulfate sulfatase